MLFQNFLSKLNKNNVINIRSLIIYENSNSSFFKKNKLKVIFAAFMLLLMTERVFANEPEVYGNWFIHNLWGEIFFVFPMETSSGGAYPDISPHFLLSFDDDGACYFSYGLTIFKDSPTYIQYKKAFEQGGLGEIFSQATFLAEKERFQPDKEWIQEVDLGDFIIARALMNSDAVVAFMQANTGRLKIEGSGIIMSFSMSGFGEATDDLLKKHCPE